MEPWSPWYRQKPTREECIKRAAAVWEEIRREMAIATRLRELEEADRG